MAGLTLTHAATIVDKALEHGRTRNFKPLTVAVLDAGGHLVAMKREDGSSILRPQIAEGKAWGTLGMGFGGREFARRVQSGPVFLTALMAASGGRVVPAPGGVLIRAGSGASSELLLGTIVDGATALLIILAMAFGLIVPKMCIEYFFPALTDAEPPASSR